MQQEFGNAYNQLKPVADAFQPIARFHQMAQQHGTTLEQALSNYTSMEQKLRSDVVGGLDVIVNNLGLKAPDGSKIGLRDIAYHVLSQSPEQLKQLQMGNAQQAASRQIGALHPEVRGLKEPVAADAYSAAIHVHAFPGRSICGQSPALRRTGHPD